MNDEIATLLKYQHGMLEKIAQLIQDSMDLSKRQHEEILRYSEGIEGFLSLINKSASA